jgi:protein-S-isoprenylcysteine O-methyltransferase Ste14
MGKATDMGEVTDRPNVVVHPPIALALALLAGFALQWLYPVFFLANSPARSWIGGFIFALGFALALWAVITFRKAGTPIPTFRPTSAIVSEGPYRYSRNPIYVGMFLGLAGLAIGYNNLWLLLMLAPFALVIRYGVVAREEEYLAQKFGASYLDYKARVRRWI